MKIDSIKLSLAILLILLLLLASCTFNRVNDGRVMENMRGNSPASAAQIDRSINGLDAASKSEVIELKSNEVMQLEAKPVVKEIDGNKIRMYAYNGQIPGPLIKVRQGTPVYINFTNNLDFDTTVHWHGIRLENKFDGVPDITQKPIKKGESFLYRLDFPDEGIYWYHPHMREDFQQELGLFGNIIVEPKDKDYFSRADKEIPLFLDDIRIKGSDIENFNSGFATFTLMGRFGNKMLVNGETDYKLNVKKGQIIRFYLTDSANTRVFNFMIENHKLKLIGSDSGKFENEAVADSIIISPGERYIAEVLFDKAGSFKMLHKIPQKEYQIGEIVVEESDSKFDEKAFYEIKENKDIEEAIGPFKKYFSAMPDFELELTLNQNIMQGMSRMMNNVAIEWEDTGHSAMMNSISTSDNVKWIIKDKKTGKANMDNNFKVKKGEIKKIRFFNNPESMHPMQHPMHLHGQRFLVLSVDGKANENLGWKDTVLVPTGKTVDILVDFENPGDWMLHCHIAEHLESGMMTMFTVS